MNNRIPPDVVSFLLKSCADSTWKNYESYIRKWIKYCSDNCIVICNPSISNILTFLHSLYENNLGYSGINTARSALSLILGKVDGFEVGNHPLVRRLLKAVYRCQPPKPKYDSVWDVSLVLNLFKGWPDKETLS